MSKKGLIILGMVAIILLGGGVAYISMQEKQEDAKGNKNVVQQEESNIVTENIEPLEYKTVEEIVESKELKELREKLKIQMPIETEEERSKHIVGNPDIFILPTILNGVKCNTIGYNEVCEQYNHRYDGLIASVKRGEASITSDIIVKIKSMKVDMGKDGIKQIEHTKKDNSYTFKIENAGRYVIECELTNRTQVSIVFETGVFG